MTENTVFPNAPITEALIDIKAILPDNIDLTALEKIHEKVRHRFPEKSRKLSLKAELQLPQEADTKGLSLNIPASGDVIGYLFKSPSDQKIFQARLDGFTFNKLKPYENWEVFSSEAKKLWALYSEIAKPVAINRIAVRYINRIDIPLPLKEFKDYILTVPEVAANISQEVAHFFMRVVIPYNDVQGFAIITETLEPVSGNVLPFILDIDVYCEQNYEPDSTLLWSDFEKLRKIKNDIFLNSITSKSKELFK